MTSDVSASANLRTPFRGLAPLRYADRPIFFGRDLETLMLRRLVVIYRGVLLYGDSGTGKSSLLNAGLIPEIESEGMRAERIRVQPRLGEELVVERVPLGEAASPPYLPSALVDGDNPNAVFSVDAFRRRITRATESETLLLIFDQFEELVTLFLESTGDRSVDPRALQQRIVQMLDELLTARTLRVKLLLAFREDYLAKLLDLLAVHTQLKSQYVRLTSPDADALRTIVLGPFEKFPDRFGEPFRPALADRLVEAILARGDADGGGRMSELQLACQRLWRSPDPEGLFSNLGLQAILEDELSASIDRLDPALRDTAVALLGHLVTPSGLRNIVGEEDLVERVRRETGTSEEGLLAALTSLERESRLVRREVRHDVAFYEIVSEFLAPWITRRRSRVALSRVQSALTPDPTTISPSELAAPDTTWTVWREQALVRIAEIDRLAAEFAQGSADALLAPQDIEDNIQRLLRAAHAEVQDAAGGGFRRRLAELWRGPALVRATAHIDDAEAYLLLIAPADYLRRQLPDIVAHARRQLPAEDADRAQIEAMGLDAAVSPAAGDVLERNRTAIVAAELAADLAARGRISRVGFFRTAVLACTAALVVLAGGLAVVGALWPGVLPLCFAAGSDGRAAAVCPVSSGASPWDVLMVELVGLVGGALSAALFLRGVTANASPYNIAVVLALLKLPSGAMTAFAGLQLLAAGFLPGFTSLGSSAQILAYALVFGFGQQLLTQYVDKRAVALLEDVRRHPARRHDADSLQAVVRGPTAFSQPDSQAARSPREGAVFISYRRADASYLAAFIHERLAEILGRASVFLDIDSIRPGANFMEEIEHAVRNADVVLAVIGERWAIEGTGRRRLEEPDDHIRRELEIALNAGVAVIPVLVGGAGMPRADELPSSLARLWSRKAFRVDAATAREDVNVLTKAVADLLAKPRRPGIDPTRTASGRPDFSR